MSRLIWQRQSGQVIGVVIGVMLAMLAAAALVIDAGFALTARRELYNAADAAALAGVQLLEPASPSNPAGGISPASIVAADAAAAAYVASNVSGGAGRLCTAATPVATLQAGAPTIAGVGVVYTYRVTVECEVGFTAGRLLGWSDMPVRVSAVAAKGSAVEVDCPLPVGLVDSDANISNGVQGVKAHPTATPTTLAFGAEVRLFSANDTGFANGNWGGIDFDGSAGGGNDFRDRFAGTKCDTVGIGSGGPHTETGQMDGPLTQGLQQRRNDDGTLAFETTGTGQSQVIRCKKSFSEIYDLATGTLRDPGSGCLGIVAVVQAPANGGNKPVTILGFAAVYMWKYQQKDNDGIAPVYADKTLIGHYIRAPVQAELGEINPLGTFVTRLIR